ncbi:MAG: hypothetical protein ACP6IP_03675 [Candidatus Njordarchaeia archaeon]
MYLWDALLLLVFFLAWLSLLISILNLYFFYQEYRVKVLLWFLVFAVTLFFTLCAFYASLYLADISASILLFMLGGLLGVSSNFSFYLAKRYMTEKDYIPGEPYIVSILYGGSLASIIFTKSQIVYYGNIHYFLYPISPSGNIVTALFQLVILFIGLNVSLDLLRCTSRSFKRRQIKFYLSSFTIGYFGVPIVLIVSAFITRYNAYLRFIFWVSVIAVAVILFNCSLFPDPNVFHLLPHRLRGIIVSNISGDLVAYNCYSHEALKPEETPTYISLSITVLEHIENKFLENEFISIDYGFQILVYRKETTVGIVLVEKVTETIKSLLKKLVCEIDNKYGKNLKMPPINEDVKREVIETINKVMDPILP